MMADSDFAQAQRQRDENHLAALYHEHAEALARSSAQNDELERTRRAFESATTSARIARLELEVAERALKQHVDAILAHSAAISPIQRLPLELLLRIFRLLAGSGARCQSSFIVAGICRRWRKLALESAALWSIFLDLVTQPAYVTEYVRTVLARSGNQSFPVTIIAPQQLGAEMMHDLDDILLDVITRAKELSIVAFNPTLSYGHQNIDISTSIFKFLTLPTPHLTRLMIFGNGFQFRDARLLPAAPSLACIESVAYPLGRLPAAPLDAVQVLCLEAQYEPPDLVILHAMVPHLRRLTIKRLLTPSTEETVTSAPAPFSRLEHLEVDGLDLLLRFSPDGLPALTHLIVGSKRFADDNSLSLPAMPLLRELRLHSPINWTQRISFFRHLAQVESLVLLPDDGSRMHAFWTEWAQRDNVEALPRLRDITIQVTGSTPLDNVAGFSEFLEARAALSTDEATAAYKIPRVTFKNVALPRWELVQLERFVGSIVIADR